MNPPPPLFRSIDFHQPGTSAKKEYPINKNSPQTLSRLGYLAATIRKQMKPIFLKTHAHDPAMIKRSTTNKLTIHLGPVFTEPNLPRRSSEDWPLPPVDSRGGPQPLWAFFFSPSGLQPELRRNNETDGGRGSSSKG